MRVRFLGTGTSQGIPVIGCTHPVCLSDDPRDTRMRSSVWVDTGEIQLVIDCGQEFRLQMLRAGISRIDAMLFTHEHADHTAGFDDIRQFSLRYGPLPVYAHPRVIANLKQRFDYIFDDTIIYEGKPRAEVYELDGNPFEIKGERIIPVHLIHGKLTVFGYRIRDFAYLTDFNDIRSGEKEKLRNLEVLVVDALRIQPHPTHLNLEQALSLISELNPRRAYLTHISHLLGFHREVQARLPRGVYLSYDGLEVEW